MKDSTYWYLIQMAVQGDDEEASKLPPKLKKFYDKLKKQVDEQKRKNPNAVISAVNSYDDIDLNF